eukprot:TRINITY_DN1002_c0_g1_i1.p1 TRINITY_DN1002_c0_g1~~TRINITY_DN1002_c0_g1_i1.p1  ORF type:complete len:120 (-),score=38.17 TRINITY_DN1002_c0_g1_i1:180-539(-)
MARTSILSMIVVVGIAAFLTLTAGSAMQSFVGMSSPASSPNMRGAVVIAEEGKRSPNVQMHFFGGNDQEAELRAQRAREAKAAQDGEGTVTFSAAVVVALLVPLGFFVWFVAKATGALP